MREYLAVLKCRIIALLQYRSAVVAGVLTQLFWGMIKTMILMALYSQTSAQQPISLSQAIIFIWLGQATLTLLPCNVDGETEEAVKSGSVVYSLTQPLDLYWLFFARSLAIRLMPTLLRTLLLLPIVFFCLSSPVSWQAGVAFTTSLFFSLFLSSAITTMVAITLFWTISGEGLQRILPHFALLFQGWLFPYPSSLIGCNLSSTPSPCAASSISHAGSTPASSLSAKPRCTLSSSSSGASCLSPQGGG